LGGLSLDSLVKISARLGPRRPEVEERNAVQVLGEQLLEVLRGGDLGDVGGGHGVDWVEGVQRLGEVDGDDENEWDDRWRNEATEDE
jgi:hypothetical protein